MFGFKFPFQISADVREQLCNSCDVGSTPNELSRVFLIWILITLRSVGGMMVKKTIAEFLLNLKEF